MMREKKLVELYAFAIRYAHSFRNTFVEVDDLAHEMMLAVMKARWKDDAYATVIMRNRFYDLARRGKLEREFSVPFDSPETQRAYSLDTIDANLIVDAMLKVLPKRQSRILNYILQGRSTHEIKRRERVSAKTVYRCMNKARESLAV